jgi:hypothetical protein
MNAQELARKVQNFETLAAESAAMNEAQRAALREEVAELLADLSPAKTMTKYAAGGAVAGAVLPVLGLFSGGAAGALWGAYQSHRSDVTSARGRLERILQTLS